MALGLFVHRIDVTHTLHPFFVALVHPVHSHIQPADLPVPATAYLRWPSPWTRSCLSAAAAGSEQLAFTAVESSRPKSWPSAHWRNAHTPVSKSLLRCRTAQYFIRS